MAGAILCTVRGPELQWTALNLEPDFHCATLTRLFQQRYSPVIRLSYLTVRVETGHLQITAVVPGIECHAFI